MELSWIMFKPTDCILSNFRCPICNGTVNNPYPYCPWCGRPIHGIEKEKEISIDPYGKDKYIIKEL